MKNRFHEFLVKNGFIDEPEPKEQFDAWAEAREKQTIKEEGSTIEETPNDLRE